MSHTRLTPAARRAVHKYGADACRQAFQMHTRDGNGAAYVAQCGLVTIRTTRQADAAINAGRELAAQVAPAYRAAAPVLTTTGRTSVDGLRSAYWLDCDTGFSRGHAIDAPEFIAAGAVVGLYSDGSAMGAAWWREHSFRTV